MTVGELIEELQRYPRDLKVLGTDAGCCGCGICEMSDIKNSEKGVFIEAHRYAKPFIAKESA